MCPQRMHTDEIDIDESLVKRLLIRQFPQWARLSLEQVPSSGTDNALFRLGDQMVVRLPRINGAVEGVEKEAAWLPLLAPLLSVAVPLPVAQGEPDDGYPWAWGIYRWIEGENPTTAAITDLESLTRDLIDFITALHQVDLPDGPPAHRGSHLEFQDEEARLAIAELGGMINTAAAAAAWDQALDTPPWSGAPVWVHGDLLPGNLLVRNGQLIGVIDWAGLGVGDPACDMIAAWALLPALARDRFRFGVGVDDATWARGRGWALSIGLIALPYYRDTNPEFAATARHLIHEALADPDFPT